MEGALQYTEGQLSTLMQRTVRPPRDQYSSCRAHGTYGGLGLKPLGTEPPEASSLTPTSLGAMTHPALILSYFIKSLFLKF